MIDPSVELDMMSSTRKILVFHGYLQNAELTKEWFAPIQEAIRPDNIELVFVDGTQILGEADIPKGLEPPPELPLALPPHVPKAWWKHDQNAARSGTYGLEDSLLKLRDILKNDRFEGVVGFSQGSAFAVLLAALLERPETFPPFVAEGQTPHPPFAFCVAFSGSVPDSPLANAILSSTYHTPTLHIQGTTDNITPEEANQPLREISANKKALHHPGGHILPVAPAWLELYRQYFLDPTADLKVPEGAEAV